MAIAFDAASEFNPPAATTGETWAHTVGSGSDRILLVWAGRTGVAGITMSVSSSVDGALTKLDGEEDPADAYIELWYLKNPTVGAHNITVTPSVSARIHGGAVSYTGVDQTTPFGTAAKANSNNVASMTASVAVSSAAGELVVAGVGRRGTAEIPSPGAGTTERVSSMNSAVTDGGTTNAGEEAGAATVTVDWTWTINNRRWAILGVPLKPAAGGGATPVDGVALDLVWDTRAQVDGGALDLVFDMRAAVDGGALDVVWDVRGTVDGGALDLVWDVGGLAPVNGAPLDLVWDVVGEAEQGGIVRKPVELVPSGVNAPRLRLVWDVAPVDAGMRRRLADLVRPAPERTEDEAEPESRRARRRRTRRLRRRSSVEAAPLRLYWDTVSRVEGDAAWLFSDVAVPVDGEPLEIGWEIRVPPSQAEDLRDIVDVLMLLS